MLNIIRTRKKHIGGYSYLSLHEFPSSDIQTQIKADLVQKANFAQFLLGKLSGITLLLPDVDYFISSYVIKDATSSAQIEGTKATIVEAMEYITDPSINTETDADDIAHYIEALKYGLTRLNEESFPFSLRFIRELHKKLMTKARSTHFSNPGEFRRSPNWIGGTRPDNASFVPPAPEELNEPLQDLESFIHNPFMHPVIDAGLLHAQFETIHPFQDGNGRTGRLLITFYLIHHKYLELPALFLSLFFKKNQKIYYQKLSDYHNGNVASWIEFFIEAVTETASQAIEISKRVTLQREKDLKTIATLSSRTSGVADKVLRNLYRDPIASTSTLEKWTGLTRPGTLYFIERMVEAGILNLHKKGEGTRPALYAHQEYIDIFIER